MLATIVWSTGDITGDSVVSTFGTPVFAISGSAESGSTVNVNGVSFVQSTRAAAIAQAQAQSPGVESLTTTIANDNVGSFQTGGFENVGQIIRGGWFGTSSAAGANVDNFASVTLTGLTVGVTYEVQIFTNDARTDRDIGYVMSVDDGNGGTGVDLQLNNSPLGESAGDFGIGTFVADATTQSFEMSGFNDGSASPGRIQINAIQLRKLEFVDLLPGAVPIINEFSASNAGVLDDDNGNSSDWIEVYNAGEDRIDLLGYSLTDDPNDTSKYVFPSTPLAGGEYLVLFAGDDVDPTSGSDLYTGFGLSRSGDYLGFYDPTGELVSEFGAGTQGYPAQFTDVSYGLLADGGFDASSFFANPTPGSANVDPVDGVIDELASISVERGFYEQAFDVEIASQTPGASIAYTTDGSEPTLTNGTRVDPANANATVALTLTIAATTSLRAAVVRDGFITQGATTHTYVFLDDVIVSDVLDPEIIAPYSDEFLKGALLDLPTISFNYDTTITDSFVPEQLTSVEWLAPDGSEGFQIDAGISAFGGYHSTSQRFTKKNFRLEFRPQYGAGQLEFPLFEGHDNGIAAATSFDSLDLRTGSHDRFQLASGNAARFVDDTLLEAGHVAPHGRYVHVYTNGVYWGQYHLRERWDADFLSQYYGGDEDDYEAVNGNHTVSDAVALNGGIPTPDGWSPGEMYDGDGLVWDQITELADTAGDGNPQGPTGGYEELKQLVNMEQYIDFSLIYMAGGAESEFRGGGSIDGSVGYTFYFNDPDRWLRETSDRTDNASVGNILGTLVDEADPEFMSLLADRIHHLFGEGGVLGAEQSTERLQARLDETARSYVLESARYERFNEAKTPADYTEDLNAVLEFLPSLAGTMISRLRARGLFPALDAPSFEINGAFQYGGEIEAGDLLTLAASDTVFYTTDGTDPRLEGGGINPEAIAYAPSIVTTTVFGDTASNSVWQFLDDGSDQGTAWRSPSFDDSGWASGTSQLGYGDGDEATAVSYGGDASDKHITTYFRKTFSVTQAFDSATLNLIYDDGAIVYLNGNLVQVVNFDVGADLIDYETTSNGAASGDNSLETIDLTEFLVVGSNTLAIEIHQASASSSDISFDATVFSSASLNGAAAISLDRSTNVRARTFSNGDWSAVHDATFVIPASPSELRISELHYNPSPATAAEIGAGFDDGDDFEFIEIFNPSLTGSINLNGVQLSDGVTFAFGDVELLPGERALVVEDIDAFMARYGDRGTILGEWSGGLSNGGEEVTLLDSSMNEIMSVNYSDSDPWYSVTDGFGFSLVLAAAADAPVGSLGKYYSWRASVEFGGSPGSSSSDLSGVVINEILAHTDFPQTDSIELFNPTDSAVNVGGWYLSDDVEALLKYQLPASAVIAAGGYLVFDESDFNASGNGFALSSEGDQVYLSEASGGEFVGLQDSVEFGATFNGDSLGRFPNGSGRLTRLSSNSFGSANVAASVGPLVISEINYHPSDPSGFPLSIDPTLTDNDLEYIEIANPTSAAVDLTDWRLRGESDFDFPSGTFLAAGAAILVVAFDPVLEPYKYGAFLTHYGISSDSLIVGGLSGSLSNSSGRISLQQPEVADAFGLFSHVVIDEVVYDDLSPFPDADGNGLSLDRVDVHASANLSTSWIAAAPTPGVFAPFVLGDTNQDGEVNFLDISPFIGLLQSGDFMNEADIDRDGDVDFLDISPFINLLSS